MKKKSHISYRSKYQIIHIKTEFYYFTNTTVELVTFQPPLATFMMIEKKSNDKMVIIKKMKENTTV